MAKVLGEAVIEVTADTSDFGETLRKDSRKAFRDVEKAAEKASKKVSESFEDVGEELEDSLETSSRRGFRKVEKEASRTSKVVREAFRETISEHSITGPFQRAFAKIGKTAKAAARGMSSSFINAAKGAATRVGGLFSAVFSRLGQTRLGRMFAPVIAAGQFAARAIAGSFRLAWSGIKIGARGLVATFRAIGTAGRAIFTGMRSAISGTVAGFRAIRTAGVNAFRAIRTAAVSISSAQTFGGKMVASMRAVGSAGAAAFRGIRVVGVGAFKAIRTAASSIGTLAFRGVKTALAGIRTVGVGAFKAIRTTAMTIGRLSFVGIKATLRGIRATGVGAFRAIGTAAINAGNVATIAAIRARNAFAAVGLAARGILSKGLAGATTAGVVGLLGKGLLDRSADIQQTLAKTEIVFGNQTKSVRKWAEEVSGAFGVTNLEAEAMASGIADLLKPMGFTTKEATKMTLELGDLSGALAQWSNGQYDAVEVGDILAKAMLGEREQLKALGIAISENDVKMRLAKKGQDELEGSALALAKAVATQELIFEKSADAQAAYKNNTNESLTASQKLTVAFKNLRDTLAVELGPLLARAATGLASGITNITGKISTLFEMLKKGREQFTADFNNDLLASDPTGAALADAGSFGITETFDKDFDRIESLKKALRTIQDTAIKVFNKVRATWAKAKDIFGPIISAVGGALKTAFEKLNDLLSTNEGKWGAIAFGVALLTPFVLSLAAAWALAAASTIAATLPLIAIAAAIGVATAAFVHFYNNNEGFANFIDNMVDKLKSLAGFLKDGLVAAINVAKDAWNGLKNLFGASSQELAAADGSGFGFADAGSFGIELDDGGLFSGIIDAALKVKDKLAEIFGGIKTFLSGAWEDIKGIFGSAFDIVGNIGGSAADAAGGAAGGAGGLIKNVVGGLFGFGKDVVLGGVGFIKTLFGFSLSDLTGAIERAIAAVAGVFSGLAGKLKSAIAKVTGGVSGGIINPADQINGAAVSAASGGGGGGFLSSLFGNIEEQINAVVERIRAAMATLPSKLAGVFAAGAAGATAGAAGGSGLLVSLFGNIEVDLEGIITRITTAFSSIPARINAALSSIGGGVSGAAGLLAGLFGNIPAQMEPVVQSVVTAFSALPARINAALAGGAAAGAGPGGGGIISSILPKIGEVTAAIERFFSATIGLFKAGYSRLAKTVGTLFKGLGLIILKSLSASFKTVVALVTAFTATLVARFLLMVTQVAAAMARMGQQIVLAISAGLNTVLAFVQSWQARLVSILSQTPSLAARAVAPTGAAMWAAMRPGLESILGRIRAWVARLVAIVRGIRSGVASAAAGVFEPLVAEAQRAASRISSIFANISNSISIPSPTVGLPGLPGTPSLPAFAEGGIIPSTPGGYPVIVGEGGSPEAIIPLNDSRRAMQLMRESGLDRMLYKTNRPSGSSSSSTSDSGSTTTNTSTIAPNISINVDGSSNDPEEIGMMVSNRIQRELRSSF